ncbi:hypothetical protein N7461_009121 [Penicillium sp. DV-2018c]|nr:hypothetical protein N7461_009121 [Penicillium sp. DV-2018c]
MYIITVSAPVPLVVIKGARDAAFPLPEGLNANVADFHTARTETESPAYITSGFYRIVAGPERPATYTYEESKYVISGEIDVHVCVSSSPTPRWKVSINVDGVINNYCVVQDEATGITHNLVAGDFAYFHVGAKVKFSTKSEGAAFYAVTRPVAAAHPTLKVTEGKPSL